MYDWVPGRNGLFSLIGNVKTFLNSYEKPKYNSLGECLNNPYIELVCKYKNKIHFRRVEVHPKSIKLLDRSNSKFHFIENNYKYYSNGYGKLIKNV